MKNVIIGIGGKTNSGKDTVASMMNYIFGVGITNAKFSEWLMKRDAYDRTYKKNIVHFADTLKDAVSIIFSIDRNKLDDRYYKDEIWYCLTEKRFIKPEHVDNLRYRTVSTPELSASSFYEVNTKGNKIPLIKIRSLLQYFGTDVCRNLFFDNIWVNSTMTKAANIAELYGHCLIPDVRFENEGKAIQFNPSTGEVVLVWRDVEQQDEHESEKLYFDATYTIENDGKLFDLFYKVIMFIQNRIL